MSNRFLILWFKNWHHESKSEPPYLVFALMYIELDLILELSSPISLFENLCQIWCRKVKIKKKLRLNLHLKTYHKTFKCQTKIWGFLWRKNQGRLFSWALAPYTMNIPCFYELGPVELNFKLSNNKNAPFQLMGLGPLLKLSLSDSLYLIEF